MEATLKKNIINFDCHALFDTQQTHDRFRQNTSFTQGVVLLMQLLKKLWRYTGVTCGIVYSGQYGVLVLVGVRRSIKLDTRLYPQESFSE